MGSFVTFVGLQRRKNVKRGGEGICKGGGEGADRAGPGMRGSRLYNHHAAGPATPLCKVARTKPSLNPPPLIPPITSLLDLIYCYLVVCKRRISGMFTFVISDIGYLHQQCASLLDWWNIIPVEAVACRHRRDPALQQYVRLGRGPATEIVGLAEAIVLTIPSRLANRPHPAADRERAAGQ